MSTAVRGRLALIATFAGIVAFYAWTAATSGVPVRLEPRSTGYYNLLAEGLLGGHLYLPVTPNPALLALSDPYDPVVNAPFRLHDAALYRGRYFLYFGPTPALILFAPFKAVTGRHLPEPIAIAASCALGVLSAFLLLRHLVSAGFRVQPPTWLWAVSLVTLGLANVAPFLLRRPAVYEVAISVGYGLVFASLLALARGAIGPRPRPAWLATSSVLLGLAAGARFPLFATGLASAVALAYWAWPGRLTPRDRLRIVVVVAAPLALAALAIGWYNYARFDSWTEFGLRYTLQGVNPKTYNMFDARRPIYGLLYYLVVPIHWSATFPFATLEPARFLQPPPYLYLEPVAGILATTPLLAALAAGPWLLRRRPLLQASAGTLAAIGTALLVVFASAGMTMRYEVDFATFFVVPAVLIWMIAIVTSPPGRFRRRILAGVFLALAGFGGTSQVLISFTGYYDTLRNSHPQTYATLRRWARPIEQTLGVPDPRIVVKLQTVTAAGDHVGCAPASFQPDGKPDLHFRLTMSPSSIGDMTAVDLVRSGRHAGAWTTGTSHFALAVTGSDGQQLLRSADQIIKSGGYGAVGLELFACDDGVTDAGDVFLARVTLADGRKLESVAVTYDAVR